MTVTSFRINEPPGLNPLTPEGLIEALKDRDAKVWLDLRGLDPAETEEWLNRLSVVGLARRLCLESDDRPGFYPLKNEIIAVVPVLTQSESSPQADHLVLLCREDLLLTLHANPIPSLEGEWAAQDSESWLPEGSISGMVAAMMIGLSLESLHRTAGLRTEVEALERRMETEADSVETEEITDLRHDILSLAAVVRDQLPSQQAFKTTERHSSDLRQVREYMNCAMANLEAADGSLHWLLERIGVLSLSFQMHGQDKTNRRLDLLTILSAIFNPITLLAGIWGMNFINMPELNYPYSYPVALGLMGVIASGMYIYFRRHGWLD